MKPSTSSRFVALLLILGMLAAVVPALHAGEGAPRMDINSASAEELATLPGVGMVKAEAIVDYRRQHGPFDTADELVRVKGIGPVLMERIRSSIQTADR